MGDFHIDMNPLNSLTGQSLGMPSARFGMDPSMH